MGCSVHTAGHLQVWGTGRPSSSPPTPLWKSHGPFRGRRIRLQESAQGLGGGGVGREAMKLGPDPPLAQPSRPSQPTGAVVPECPRVPACLALTLALSSC